LKSDVERFMRESGVTQAEVKSCAERVLIIDDDPLMTTYVHDILEDSGLGFMTETAQISLIKKYYGTTRVILARFLINKYQ
jgi:hypothetical protein